MSFIYDMIILGIYLIYAFLIISSKMLKKLLDSIFTYTYTEGLPAVFTQLEISCNVFGLYIDVF